MVLTRMIAIDEQNRPMYDMNSGFFPIMILDSERPRHIHYVGDDLGKPRSYGPYNVDNSDYLVTERDGTPRKPGRIDIKYVGFDERVIPMFNEGWVDIKQDKLYPRGKSYLAWMQMGFPFRDRSRSRSRSRDKSRSRSRSRDNSRSRDSRSLTPDRTLRYKYHGFTKKELIDAKKKLILSPEIDNLYEEIIYIDTLISNCSNKGSCVIGGKKSRNRKSRRNRRKSRTRRH